MAMQRRPAIAIASTLFVRVRMTFRPPDDWTVRYNRHILPRNFTSRANSLKSGRMDCAWSSFLLAASVSPD